MQDKIPEKPKIIDNYELERLVYNLRRAHKMLRLYGKVINELNLAPPLSSLEKEKSELEGALAVLKKNNENQALNAAAVVLQDKLDALDEKIATHNGKACIVQHCIQDTYPWYLNVIKLLDEKDYIKDLEKDGKAVREFDLDDDIIITVEQQKEERRQRFEATKDEGPVPRRLSGILPQNPFESSTTDVPAPPGDESRNNLGTSP